MTSLTKLAQQELASQLSPGESAIDATAGNGHDTLFLARQVGKAGHVYSFDIQQQAIDNTRSALQQADQLQQVSLFCHDHAQMPEVLPTSLQCKVIMFNLGYLPGSDKSCITHKETTLLALQHSLQYLHAQGTLSIMLYPGHSGGNNEARAVLEWVKQLPNSFVIKHEITPGPQWLYIRNNIPTQPS